MVGNSVPVEGLKDLTDKLRSLAPKMRVRVLRNSLAAGARIVRDDAKKNAPVLSGVRKTPYRKPGTVRDAIAVRNSKRDRRAGDVGVFVNVRPAKGGNRGAKNPLDPFFWRWQEFGWNPARKGESKKQRRAENKAMTAKRKAGRKFITGAISKLPQALEVFKVGFGKWLVKVNATGKVSP